MIRRGSERGATFGARVRQARLAMRGASGRRWTQDDLARAVEVERNTVSRWENGGVLPRDPAVVARVAAALGVTTDWLLGAADSLAGAEEAATHAAGQPHGAAVTYERLLHAYSGRRRGGAALPPAAIAVMAGYLGRLAAAGCLPHQVKEAERLMVQAARNRVASVPFADRPGEDVISDIDAAWDFVSRLLRREGRRP